MSHFGSCSAPNSSSQCIKLENNFLLKEIHVEYVTELVPQLTYMALIFTGVETCNYHKTKIKKQLPPKAMEI